MSAQPIKVVFLPVSIHHGRELRPRGADVFTQDGMTAFSQRTPVMNKDLITNMQSQFHGKGGTSAAEGAAFSTVGGEY